MEKSSFFNSINHDRRYKAEEFAEYFASFIGDGIFPNPSTNLQVLSNNDMTVNVKQGKAWIKGYFYVNTDDLKLKIDVADSVLSRVDRIVLRKDVAQRKIYCYVKKGQFASSPVAPALQRDADMYELGLADIYVRAGVISIIQSNITDLRLNKELCGIVHGAIDQVDVTTLFNQYTEKFKLKEEEFETEFKEWITQLKDILEGDVAGNLLNLINKNKDSIYTVQDNIDKLDSQLADITTYQTAGGTATSINLNLPTLVNGYATTFIVSSNNNKNATTINGKKLYKPNTTTTPNLTAGKAVSVWYNATKDCFFIKASAEGNAIAENVLAGKTFSNDDDTGIAGTMPNRGTFNLGFGATVPAGYYSGGIVPNGKRWACGELSVTINTDRIMSVTGLSFTPSKVIVSCYKYSGSPYTDSLNLIISNIADIYNMYGSFTDHSGDEITSHGEKIKSRIITRGFNVYLPKIGDGGNLKYWAYE
ncbi:hypothetical protein FC823_08985 [Clostridium botulinum]|uniref:hypothetical protein n=1 Tax=Clostridium botulinum TaxID=1491 RepID=UPI00015920C0|nr:hypothetical protein [Clostridium botulinum]ABS33971.1 conserved domain protein [Clostridium botulinum A str. ATCC 19397]NFH04129.1 hypothetical protein [Clostridium botulinum]NFM48301.1 hypothetical protein [Clostridium botulinum]QRC52162.1 hypothetical protein JMA41_13970 [Clostridium botulinum]